MYTLDQQSAREAENVSAFLNKTGKYKGTITRAQKLISTNKGTHGIGFTFADDSKQTTRFDIWTQDKDGKPLMGRKMLDALMVCARKQKLTVAKGEVERYDYDTKKMVKEQAEVFPELTGAQVGFLLRSTEYEKMKDGHLTGQTGWRLEPVCPFDYATELTAAEVMDKKTKPEKLAGLVATLADRPLRNRPAARAEAPATSHGFDDGFDAPPDNFDQNAPW